MRELVIVLVAATALTLNSVPTAGSATALDPVCGLPSSGQLDVEDVPEGLDVVDCDAVGRPLDLGDAVLEIPAPGTGVGLSADLASGGSIELSVETASDGAISYETQPSAPASSVDPPAGYDVDGCDTNYLGAGRAWWLRTRDIKYLAVGDGGQPGGGTVATTADAINKAGDTYALEQSPCTSQDQSLAPYVRYWGTTTYESDFKIVNGESTCADRDGVDTLDTGNLDGGMVAMACVWFDGNDLVTEGDIRLDTDDYNFVLNPSQGCSNQYDVRSVITHEIGHIYGLKDKYDTQLSYQTMFGNSFFCRTFARNLGKSDVKHLRAQYSQNHPY